MQGIANGVICGDASGQPPSTAPWTNGWSGELCKVAGVNTSSYTANETQGPYGNWTWTCGTSQCGTSGITCGSDNGGTFTEWPDTANPGHLCNNGSDTDAGSSQYNGAWNGTFQWYCGSQLCAASYVTCGNDNGQAFNNWPETANPGHLCNVNGYDTSTATPIPVDGWLNDDWTTNTFHWECGSPQSYQDCYASYAPNTNTPNGKRQLRQRFR